MDLPVSFTFLTAIKDGYSDFRKTVPTVLSQSDPDFEWIIVDDGSREPVANAFPELERDPRVKIMRNEQGKGQTVSLNAGIREARGTWIVRMDGDDLCSPERLAIIRRAVASAGSAQLLFSDYKVIDGSDREWAEVRMKAPLPPEFFLYLERQNNPICHPTVAFRRQAPDGRIRLFREDLVNAQDYALWKEILAEGGAAAFLHLPFPSISYRVVRDSLSGARAREQEVEKNAIRQGQTLQKGEQSRPALSDQQKNAMQAFRLLYYRFVGHAAKAPLSSDLALLRETLSLPGYFPKAMFFLIFRPLRKLLLRRLFAGIYG